MTAIFIRKESADRYQCVNVIHNDGKELGRLIVNGKKQVANIVTVFSDNVTVSPILNESAVDELIHTAKKVYM